MRVIINKQGLILNPAANTDLIILRESTEGLFYSAAVHGRSEIIGDSEVRDYNYVDAPILNQYEIVLVDSQSYAVPGKTGAL